MQQKSSAIKSILICTCIVLLTACGPSTEDAKKLGFTSVDQMKMAEKAGFKNGDEYAFMTDHGFDTKAEYDQYKSATPENKVRIGAKNAAKKEGFDVWLDCYALNEILTYRLNEYKHIEKSADQNAVTGTYDFIGQEYIKNGKSKSEIQEMLVKKSSEYAGAMDNNPNEITVLTDKAVSCMNKFVKYFAEAPIDNYYSQNPTTK